MVIAMVAVWMVETSVHQVVNVIAVRYRLMAAAGTVLMTIATHFRGAADRVAFADLDNVLFNAIAFWMVQMSVLKIIYMVSVSDGDMPAMGAMMVGRAGIGGGGHGGLLLLSQFSP